jgi:hypothetical protein
VERFLLIVVAVVLSGCRTSRESSVDQGPPAWFEDVTDSSGINFVHVRGQTRYWLPEITGSGGAWIDYDRDGDLDLYLVQSGDLAAPVDQQPGNVLYQNLGNGKFTDVTRRAGVGDRGYGMGAAVADYDGDGFDDLYVTNVGPNVLFRNNGNGTFQDVTESAGVGHTGWSTSAAFFDYDRDGDLDLFVTNYIHWSPATDLECYTSDNRRDYCTPESYHAPLGDVLYRNRGDGTFEDVSTAAGLRTADGNGFGIAIADFNQDGRLDIYVANDGNPNQLWIQTPDGRFGDQGFATGCAVDAVGAAEAGMGVSAVDIENDGDLDLFVTNLVKETNTLYLNEEGLFRDATAIAGLAASSLPFTGFGLGFADFDHDQELDLYIANGRVSLAQAPIASEDPFAEPDSVMRGVGGGRFEEVRPPGGTRPTLNENSRAALFGDYDADGDVDVLVTNNGGRARLLENRVASRGNWIRFNVLASDGREATGAAVRIETAGKVQWRLVGRTFSYLASNDPVIHFGLGEATSADRVLVRWPNGTEQPFGSFAAGKTHTLSQSE